MLKDLKKQPIHLFSRHPLPDHFDNFFVKLEKKMKNLPGVRLNELLAEAQKHHDSFELKILPIGEKTAILPVKKNGSCLL